MKDTSLAFIQDVFDSDSLISKSDIIRVLADTMEKQAQIYAPKVESVGINELIGTETDAGISTAIAQTFLEPVLTCMRLLILT